MNYETLLEEELAINISDPAGNSADTWLAVGENAAINDLAFACRRAASRLHEMSSDDYISRNQSLRMENK